MSYVLSKRSLSRYAGIDPVLIDILKKSVTNSPYDFGAPEFAGMRTEKDQKDLFENGLSQCDGLNNKSAHQSGEAFDIYAYVEGRASWDVKHLLPIARHIQSVALGFGVVMEWGGEYLTKPQKRKSKHEQNLFKATGQGWDAAHFQIKFRFKKL